MQDADHDADVAELASLDLLPYRAVEDRALAGMLQQDLEAFNKASEKDPNAFVEPMSAAQCARASELSVSDKVCAIPSPHASILCGMLLTLRPRARALRPYNGKQNSTAKRASICIPLVSTSF